MRMAIRRSSLLLKKEYWRLRGGNPEVGFPSEPVIGERLGSNFPKSEQEAYLAIMESSTPD